jgi:hypothetical protein
MPYSRLEWWRYINEVGREYEASRVAVARLAGQLLADPNLLNHEPTARQGLPQASRNLEGTYLIRVFAAFESALRSYERWWHPERVGADAGGCVANDRRDRGASRPRYSEENQTLDRPPNS